jgi:hypothetical protein
MVRFASGGLRQMFAIAESGVKLVTFILSARVLPIGTVWVGESAFQLFLKGFAGIQIAEKGLRILTPVYTSRAAVPHH